MPTDTSTLVRIVVQGCDEATEVNIALTAGELRAIDRLAEAINTASESDCHPRIEVIG